MKKETNKQGGLGFFDEPDKPKKGGVKRGFSKRGPSTPGDDDE